MNYQDRQRKEYRIYQDCYDSKTASGPPKPPPNIDQGQESPGLWGFVKYMFFGG